MDGRWQDYIRQPNNREPSNGNLASAASVSSPRGSGLAVSPLVEAGNVYLPHPSIAPWVEGFIEECAQFPNGRHDDQVDQMTQALIKMRSRPPARELPPQEPMPVSPYGGSQGGNWML